MKLCSNNIEAESRRYVPLPIGNGDLSLMIDFQGSMEQVEYSGRLTPAIWRAGVRHDTVKRELVNMGYFSAGPENPGEVKEWTQSLDTDSGLVESSCVYLSGTTVHAQTFCHLEKNIVVMRRRIEGDSCSGFTLKFSFGGRRVSVTGSLEGCLEYEIDGQEAYKDQIHIFCSKPAKFDQGDSWWSLSTDEREFDIFLVYGSDNAAYAREKGFDLLLQENRRLWEAYHAEGGVTVPSKRIQEVYETAQYHLRITTTRWSIPVGLYETHWNGRYFGFDEYFAFGGLLSTGHLSMARRVPEFRKLMLQAALERSSYYARKVDGSARYVWQTVEAPGVEAAAPGLWIEHIFHMATIAQSAFEYYQATGDLEFLREVSYPVIRGCAEFFRIHSVYHMSDSRVIIGKCTDLERLGAGRENAFMTTCGAISTFRAAACAAEALGVDANLFGEWRSLADALAKNLPHDNEKYVPYPGCDQKSIAVLAGTFPYPALNGDDPLEHKAASDLLSSKNFGNMYPGGKSICTWYAGWIALYFARHGEGDMALEILQKTADETGCFSEIFEIYESGNHPWFSTAEGCFVQAVNELFVQGDNILPACPSSWKDFSFKLQGRGGKTHEYTYSNGCKA